MLNFVKFKFWTSIKEHLRSSIWLMACFGSSTLGQVLEWSAMFNGFGSLVESCQKIQISFGSLVESCQKIQISFIE